MEHHSKKPVPIRKKGFALIETLLSVLIASVLLVSFSSLALHSKAITRDSIQSLKANLYLREMIEAAKDLELSNWDELRVSCTVASPCHPAVSSNKWVLSGGEEVLDNSMFGRRMVVYEVCRDQLDFPNEIRPCDGVNPVDPNTKLVIAFVKWPEGPGIREVKLESFVYKL